MEGKVYKSNKISLELLEQLKDCELELGQQMPYYGYNGMQGMMGGYGSYHGVGYAGLG
jgi:hypothetical protein